MKKAGKLFVTLVAVTLLIVYCGGAAYAAEADQMVNGQIQDTSTGIADNSSDTVEYGTIDDQNPINDADVYIDDQGQIYDKGDPVDEHGDVLTPDNERDISEDTNDINDKDDSDVKDSDNSTSGKTDGKKSKDSDKDKKDKKPSYSEKDLRLLSSLIYAEAGGQPYEGQLAVANIVLNRLKSDVYSHCKTIKDVIYDRKWSVQFSVTVKCNGTSAISRALKTYDNDQKSMQKAIKAAKAALEGENNIGGFLCFQNKRYVSSIKRKYSNYKVIGNHVFYRCK